GLTGEQLVVQADKAGYTTAVRFGVKLDEPDLVVEIKRGAIVRGKVMAGEQPLGRFRVDTRTTEIPKPADAGAKPADAGAAAAAEQQSRNADDGRGGPPWMRRGQRAGTRQLAEGQTMVDRGMNGLDGDWREIQSADGTFELRGIPPGRVRVRARADGWLDAQEQTVDLQPRQTRDVLVFMV